MLSWLVCQVTNDYMTPTDLIRVERVRTEALSVRRGLQVALLMVGLELAHLERHHDWQRGMFVSDNRARLTHTTRE